MRSLNSLTRSCPHSFSVYPVAFPVSVRLPLVLMNAVLMIMSLQYFYNPYAKLYRHVRCKVLNLPSPNELQKSHGHNKQQENVIKAHNLLIQSLKPHNNPIISSCSNMCEAICRDLQKFSPDMTSFFFFFINVCLAMLRV